MPWISCLPKLTDSEIKADLVRWIRSRKCTLPYCYISWSKNPQKTDWVLSSCAYSLQNKQILSLLYKLQKKGWSLCYKCKVQTLASSIWGIRDSYFVDGKEDGITEDEKPYKICPKEDV